jgi:hypothetical protein
MKFDRLNGGGGELCSNLFAEFNFSSEPSGSVKEEKFLDPLSILSPTHEAFCCR